MKVTVGATLVTVTGWVAMLLLSLSESVTRILTSGLAGPSGKSALEGAAPLAVVVRSRQRRPPVPQSGQLGVRT